MSFTAASSSVRKGESLLDTVQTIEAMGVDAMVVRHQCAGAPHRIASWIDAAVVNAGDGRHEHPTQALLDLLTLRRHLGTDAFRRAPDRDRRRRAPLACRPQRREGVRRRRRRRHRSSDLRRSCPNRLEGWPVTRRHRPRRRAPRARRRLPAAHPARAPRGGAPPVAARVHEPLRADRRPRRPTQARHGRHARRAR